MLTCKESSSQAHSNSDSIIFLPKADSQPLSETQHSNIMRSRKAGWWTTHSVHFSPTIQGLSTWSSEQQCSLRINQIWWLKICGLISAPSGSYSCLGWWQDARIGTLLSFLAFSLTCWVILGQGTCPLEVLGLPFGEGANCIHLLVRWQENIWTIKW